MSFKKINICVFERTLWTAIGGKNNSDWMSWLSSTVHKQ